MSWAASACHGSGRQPSAPFDVAEAASALIVVHPVFVPDLEQVSLTTS